MEKRAGNIQWPVLYFSVPPPLTKSDDDTRVSIDLMKRLSCPALPVVVWPPEENYHLAIRSESYALKKLEGLKSGHVYTRKMLVAVVQWCSAVFETKTIM